MKRVLFTLVRWIGGAVLLMVVAVLVLVTVFDMRLVFDGGMSPRLIFSDPNEHFAELEANRLEQPTVEEPVSEADTQPHRQPAVTTPVWTDFRGPNRDGQYLSLIHI